MDDEGWSVDVHGDECRPQLVPAAGGEVRVDLVEPLELNTADEREHQEYRERADVDGDFLRHDAERDDRERAGCERDERHLDRVLNFARRRADRTALPRDDVAPHRERDLLAHDLGPDVQSVDRDAPDSQSEDAERRVLAVDRDAESAVEQIDADGEHDGDREDQETVRPRQHIQRLVLPDEQGVEHAQLLSRWPAGRWSS